MDKNKRHITDRILTLALEIIYSLTGEDYTVVKKTSGECVAPSSRPRVSGGWSGSQTPVTDPPPPSLIPERNNEQKILDLTHKIIELLTGEVPIRCQDVTVYFSMEEWEYLEGHKDLYKEFMMEKQWPLTSPDGSSKRDPPERCPRPLCSHDCPEEDPNVPEDPQIDGAQISINFDEDLIDLKVEVIEEEPFIRDDRPLKEEEDPTAIGTEAEREIRDVTQDFPGEHPITMSQFCLFSTDLTSDPSNHVEQFPDQPYLNSHNSEQSGGQLYSCSECEKCFLFQSKLLAHKKTHKKKKKFLCSECGIYFALKSALVQHQKLHTDEEVSGIVQHLSHGVETSFHCSDCGERFADRLVLLNHQRNHLGLKTFSCSECGKYFSLKSGLVRHQRIHTGEKPFPCYECWKFFAVKSNLVKHQRIHTGEKPFLCSECGKRFTQKPHFIKHQRTHTGERPYSCSDCGKRFSQKPHLVKHTRIHTGEKPFICSECGRCFTGKQILLKHQRVHMS